MPWTFSHPAAVLPLRRFTPKYLSLPALVCGSMSPDMSYYIGDYGLGWGTYAHTAAGSVVLDVPVGLACLLLFCVLRRPLWFLLPQPHRSALAPLLESAPWRRGSFLIVAPVSVLIGAWTHNFWDSFTHYNGWMVLHLPFLHAVCRYLQYLSTVVGIAALALAYVPWLRRQPHRQPGTRVDAVRYIAAVVALVVAVAVAYPFALRGSEAFGSNHGFQVLVIELAIYTGTVLGLIVLVYSAVYAVVAVARGR
jgi:uncharacterized protein DUF4184